MRAFPYQIKAILAKTNGTLFAKMLAALCMLNSAGAKTLDRADQGHPSDHSDAMMLASTSSAWVPPSDDKACEPSNLNSSALASSRTRPFQHAG